MVFMYTKKFSLLLIISIVAFINCFSVFADTNDNDNYNSDKGDSSVAVDSSDLESFSSLKKTSPTFRNYLLSYLNTQFDNMFLSFYNRTIDPKPYADIDLDIIYHNITNPWVWDDDEFNINHIGHPYQGSMYHQGARANGLNFYESLAVTSFGSLTWELLMENETPSFNDIIVTSIQGSMFGEILHRIYLDTTSKIPVLPAFIAPQSALIHFITGTPCPNFTNSHIQEFSLGIGSAIYNSSITTFNSNLIYDKTYFPQIDLNVILNYGDVYKEATWVPFESFSIYAIGSIVFPFNYAVFMNGDGVLFSIIPDFKTSTAISLDLIYQYYDAFFNINFSNNALGATIQQKIDVNDDTSIEWKEQFQFAFLAGYDCHYLLVEDKRSDPFDNEQRLYDLGIGVGNNASFTFKNPTIGNFKLEAYAGIFKTIPVSVQTEGSDGFSAAEYVSVDYEHKIYKNLSFAINSLFYFRQAVYDDLENYTQFANDTSVFVRYNFL